MSAGNKRRTVHYAGRVQGVGFRYTAKSLAQRYQVTGYVQNSDDGRVRLEIEGPSEEIDRYLTELSEIMGRYIQDLTVVSSAATGEFSDFSVLSTSN